MRRAVAVSLLASGLAGCISLSGPTPAPVHRYQLSYSRPAAAQRTLPVVLQLLPLQSAAAAESDRIAYRDGEYRLNFYNYRSWTVRPARMIGDLIQRDLADSQAFRAVVRGPSPLRPDFSLGGVVEEIEERTADGCTAHLRIRFTLMRQTSAIGAEPVFQREYKAHEPCTEDDVETLVAAMSLALQSISERLRGDIIAAIEAPAHQLGGDGGR